MVRGVFLKAKECVAISGAHTFKTLLKERCPKNIVKAIDACGESPRHGCVFLSYKNKSRKDLELGSDTGPIWINDKYFISHRDNTDGSLSIYLLWEMPFIPRDGSYEEKKWDAAEEVKNDIFKLFPKLKDFDAQDASTPATTEAWICGNNKGCSYGLAHSVKRFCDWETVRALRPQTDLPNVYMIGQDTSAAGFTAGLFNGVLAAQTILTGTLNLFDYAMGNDILSKVVRDSCKN